VFCIYLRTNSDFCHIQLKLVFITEMKSVYCEEDGRTVGGEVWQEKVYNREQ
jgi:hypothetical protein